MTLRFRQLTLLALSVILAVAQLVQAQTSVEVFVPSAINKDELGDAKRILALSEAQSVLLDRLHATYAEAWQAAVKELLPDVQGAGNKAGELFVTETGAFGQDAVDAFGLMESRRVALLNKLAQIDAELWSQLEPLLSEVQASQLVRVVDHRRRERCRLTNRALPGAGIDLVRLLRVQQIQVEPGSDLDLILGEYDAAVTGPWMELDAYLAKSETAELQAAVDLLFATPGGGGSDDAYSDRIRRLAYPAVRLQRRIVTINSVFMPQIAALLPAERREAFEFGYRRTAFPMVYPDIYDPSELYLELMQTNAVNDEQRAILGGMWTEFWTGYQSKCREMERCETERWQEFALTRGSEELKEFHATMMDLRRERIELTKAFVSNIPSALPPELAPTIKPLIDAYHGRAASVQRAPEPQYRP